MSTAFSGLIGIDLGTTYSCAARLTREGLPQTVPNREGELITPSVVMIEDDLAVVGREAKRSECVYPDRTAVCVKRDMGDEAYSKVLAGQSYRPEILSALILKRIKADFETRFGPVRQAVITVPAYFDDTRRKATQDAGGLAGLNVIDIINEPTAAALAFAFDAHLRRQGQPDGFARQLLEHESTVLVFDLGGGTFDVAIVRMSAERFATLATDGDLRLGGRDWDERLVGYLAEEFARQHGSDPRSDPESLAFLYQAAEQAKHALTARQTTRVMVSHAARRMSIEVTRTQFELLTADLLQRVESTTQEVLRSAGLTWDQFDRVLLVGGMTRVPQVRDMLRRISGHEPDAGLSADEVVAHGAAIHGGILLSREGSANGAADSNRQRAWSRFETVDVNAHSLGVAVRTAQGYANSILIPRNSPLPVSRRRIYRTSVADQRQVRVRVLEGESRDADACAQIGEFILKNLPAGLPERAPIEVECRYGSDGRISVVGQDVTSGQIAETTILRQGRLEEGELAEARERLEKLQIV
ncbi:MAG: Hsp70 family protein [Planctomycetaceae bacterium]|nr:Hsp70 family protein [Planctomycetaceae bacterium]